MPRIDLHCLTIRNKHIKYRRSQSIAIGQVCAFVAGLKIADRYIWCRFWMGGAKARVAQPELKSLKILICKDLPRCFKLLGQFRSKLIAVTTGFYEETVSVFVQKSWWKGLHRFLVAVLVLSFAATSLPLSAIAATPKIAEASTPPVIQQLRRKLDRYQPQVQILSPKPGETLQDTRVSLQFQVKDLPIYKDATLGLGPHLHVFLDDENYQAVYDVSQPFVLQDLKPGTHTVRVFASRPWHESFKNDGAFAQVTFHVFTKTQDDQPNPDLPLLTYSRPQGKYGAEPIMLDYYLTNAPLHIVAADDQDVRDWRVKATINGDSFMLDQWQPIYLKGLQPGQNWAQLEFVDEQGNPIANVFNNTVKLFDYQPGGDDALSKLVRGELTAAAAMGIVDPNYRPPAATPAVAPKPVPVAKPAEQPADQPIAPIGKERPTAIESEGKTQPGVVPIPIGKPTVKPEVTPAVPSRQERKSTDSKPAAAVKGVPETSKKVAPEKGETPSPPSPDESQPEAEKKKAKGFRLPTLLPFFGKPAAPPTTPVVPAPAKPVAPVPVTKPEEKQSIEKPAPTPESKAPVKPVEPRPSTPKAAPLPLGKPTAKPDVKPEVPTPLAAPKAEPKQVETQKLERKPVEKTPVMAKPAGKSVPEKPTTSKVMSQPVQPAAPSQPVAKPIDKPAPAKPTAKPPEIPTKKEPTKAVPTQVESQPVAPQSSQPVAPKPESQQQQAQDRPFGGFFDRFKSTAPKATESQPAAKPVTAPTVKPATKAPAAPGKAASPQKPSKAPVSQPETKPQLAPKAPAVTKPATPVKPALPKSTEEKPEKPAGSFGGFFDRFKSNEPSKPVKPAAPSPAAKPEVAPAVQSPESPPPTTGKSVTPPSAKTREKPATKVPAKSVPQKPSLKPAVSTPSAPKSTPPKPATSDQPTQSKPSTVTSKSLEPKQEKASQPFGGFFDRFKSKESPKPAKPSVPESADLKPMAKPAAKPEVKQSQSQKPASPRQPAVKSSPQSTSSKPAASNQPAASQSSRFPTTPASTSPFGVFVGLVVEPERPNQRGR